MRYLSELSKGDTHVSISVRLLDRSVCNAAQLLIRNIHPHHHPQHLNTQTKFKVTYPKPVRMFSQLIITTYTMTEGILTETVLKM